MFTADVPGVARSASGEMARTAESRLCRERPDRGSGRRDLGFVNREVPFVVEEIKNADGKVVRRRLHAVTPEVAALVPHSRLVVRELTPARRGVTAADLEALRARFRRA